MPPATFKSSDIFAVLGLSLSVFVLAGPPLASMGNLGIVILQLGAFALPALLVAGGRERGFDALGFRACSALTLFGAALLAASLWYWNAYWIAPIGEDWASLEQTQAWSETLALDKRALWESLLVFALLPAVCEELLHRGVITPALARRLGFFPGLLLSALIFGLLHFNLARLLPTTVLGLAAGYVRLRTGSLLPSMLVHFLYNAGLLLAAHWALELSTPMALLSVAATTIAVVFIAKLPQLQGDLLS